MQPASGWRLLNVAELWRYRELLLFFTWRDVLIRYKQTALGAGWAILQPFMMMVVFTIFLGRVAKVDSGAFPYPVFVYAGLLPWTFFSTGVTRAGNSVVGDMNIITKVYFPRLVIPLSSVGAAAVDFVLSFGILLVLMVVYGVPMGWGLLFVPALLVLCALAAMGTGTILAALNVAYRDFKYTIPFLLQIWMFATPTVYMHVATVSDPAVERRVAASHASTADAGVKKPASERSPGQSVPAFAKTILRLNPMTGLIAFFRASTLGGPLPWRALGYSTAIILAMFLCGLLYFRRVEDRFADII